MDPELQKLLDEGIASLRIGNKDEARRKLMQVINADERNESAWLYLSEAVESDEDRQVCLENVLTLNPANQRAEMELEALRKKLAPAKTEEDSLICPTCGVANPPGSQRCFSCYSVLGPAGTAVAEVPPAAGLVSEPLPRQTQHKSFMEMLDTWGEMFTLPGRARLDEEHAYARWGLTVPGILIASGITYFFVMLANAGAAAGMLSGLPGGNLELTQLLPIACGGAVGGAVFGLISFVINSGIMYLAARLLGGRGEFVIQSYLMSLVYGPYSLVFGIISPLALLSTVNPALGFIPSLLSIPISILMLIMLVRTLKSTHSYGTGAALGTIFLPGIFFGCLCALLAMLAGSTLSSLPFNLSDFQP